MIHLVTAENRHLYRRQLERMHQLRRAFFVEERGWTDRMLRDGGEFDDLDDDQADYLLSLEPDGDIGLSARIRPTADRSMLADCFSELLSEAASSVKAPGVWELSRYFASPRRRGPEGLMRNMELRTAVVAACLRRGAHRLVAVTDVYLMNTVIRTGWEHRFLGLPQAYAHGEAIAFEVRVDARVVEAMMERHGLRHPLLLHALPEEGAGLEPQELELLAQASAVLSPRDLHVLSRIIERLDTAGEDLSDQAMDELMGKVRTALLG
ncbi:MAG: hypothetical protein M3M95_05120 [Pseudomonadota bacterium]|nr:hypothetical protein [Pseudomonadota bacterium]